jgi:hypothetical protein
MAMAKCGEAMDDSGTGPMGMPDRDARRHRTMRPQSIRPNDGLFDVRKHLVASVRVGGDLFLALMAFHVG